MLEEEGQLVCGREEGELWETPAREHGAPFRREGSGYAHVCAFTYTCVPARAFANSHVHVRAFMYTRVPARAFANSHVHVHVVHTQSRAYICMSVCACACAHACPACVCVCGHPCVYVTLLLRTCTLRSAHALGSSLMQKPGKHTPHMVPGNATMTKDWKEV